MARLNGLGEGWLNDGVKGLLPGPDAQAGALLDLPGLAVAVASPRYPFAMKVFAARVDRHVDDLRTLYHLSKFQSLDEAFGYVASVREPTHSPSQRVRGARGASSGGTQ
jgi:hypothetical protein